MNYFNVFGHNLYRLRKENKLTQKEMADKLGISISSLRKLENGIVTPRLTINIIFNASKEFSIEPYELFEI
ncbi:MAG: helix-turn-helix transcriptional regulator [Clostridia bacterium]|nr:helix-turn-helix transcriptional regulator [Clostridia bacterium]